MPTCDPFSTGRLLGGRLGIFWAQRGAVLVHKPNPPHDAKNGERGNDEKTPENARATRADPRWRIKSPADLP
jgi:hypothetical protein